MTAMRGLIIALAVLAASCGPAPGSERFPVPSDYPPSTMERSAYQAPNGWRITTLQTPERPEATWKVVIITGTPSWNEFWAPTIAAAPDSREVVVANRPGFRDSDPVEAVTDLNQQVEALTPMLEVHSGEHVVLVGQSFGAPIATLMAARYPDRVQAVVLVSPYFGDRGPTARRLVSVGSLVQGILPRDLKHGVAEIRGQQSQLPAVWAALGEIHQPMVFIHGDADNFVPLAASEHIAGEYHRTLITVPGGDHFLNACCVAPLWGAIEQAIAEADGREPADPPPAPAATP